MTLGAILLASKVWDDQAGYRWFGGGGGGGGRWFGSSNKAQAVGDITSLVLCAKEGGGGGVRSAYGVAKRVVGL